MRKILNILFIGLFFSCDSEHVNDCFQKTGEIIKQEVSVETFNKILVNRDIELIIKENSEQKIEIETGKNLFKDVEAKVEEGTLVLTDKNTCNFVRDYDVTKVYVASPNIVEIRSSTQYDVRSDGVLTYPILHLLSEDFSAPDTFTSGNFRLEVNNESLKITFNNLSNAFISGSTNNFFVGLFAGTSRIEAGELIAQNVELSHRSSNDIIVNPLASLKGVIRGTGNVISKKRPVEVLIEELYTGRLIFE